MINPKPKILKLLFFIMSLSIYSLEAGTTELEGDPPDTQLQTFLMKIDQAAHRALDFVLNAQVQLESPDYKIGEWPSYVSMGGKGAALGVFHKGQLEDANVFTTASIHNILVEIVEKRQIQEGRIIEAIKSSYLTFDAYQTNSGAFNFWRKNSSAGPDGHLPDHELTTPLFRGFADVPGDADDTAVTWLAKLLNLKLMAALESNQTASPSQKIGSFFSKHLDHGFRISFIPNFFDGEIATGAYLTWLSHEPYVPVISSAFFPASYGPRMPLGKNNVDCVVNANVLRVLKVYGEEKTPGFHASCEYLNRVSQHHQYNSCGIYYPNTYWLHYSVARAYEDGVSCLEKSIPGNLAHLLKSQRSDGSWTNELAKNDETMATALALGALLKTGDRQNPEHLVAVRRAVQYLLTQENPVNTTEDSSLLISNWKEGIFFSAGTGARLDVLWYSKPLTTAMILQDLLEAKEWLRP
jgi:hypothetical protein